MTMTHQRADETLHDALNTIGAVYVWLHTGDPGEAGTANVAQLNTADIVRKAVEFGDPANHTYNATPHRRCLSTTEVAWSGEEIDEGQTITHFSIWDQEAVGGQPEFISGVVESKMVGSDGVVIEIGDLEAAIEVYVQPT